ncbi:MAG: nuc [Micrococcaceae bacterium]|nr:nuc [Micrococcaceae bacterium]
MGLTSSKTVAFLAACALFGGLTSCSTADTAEKADNGKVVRIVDGDTLVITIADSEKTVRLLNVDTPETKDPNKPVECLGPEATKYLESTLPVGSLVKLKYDVERQDKYGRTLAAVFTKDDLLVNAEIARQGLGSPMSVGENTKYLPPVQAAFDEAKKAAVGLFSATTDCTLPAQIETALTALDAAAAAGTATTSTGAGTAITTATAALATAEAVQSLLTAGPDADRPVLWGALAAADITRHLSRLSTGIGRISNRITELQGQKRTFEAAEAKAAEDKAAAEAQAAADRAAADRAAAAEQAAAAAAQAAATAAANAAAVEAERIRNLPAPPVYVAPAPAPAPQPYVPPAQQAPSNPYPGYTGPRCYAPGAKSWSPCP